MNCFFFIIWVGFFSKFTNNSGKNRKHAFHQDHAYLYDCGINAGLHWQETRIPVRWHFAVTGRKIEAGVCGKEKKKRIWSICFHMYVYMCAYVRVRGWKCIWVKRGNQDLVLLSLFPGAADISKTNVVLGVGGFGSMGCLVRHPPCHHRAEEPATLSSPILAGARAQSTAPVEVPSAEGRRGAPLGDPQRTGAGGASARSYWLGWAECTASPSFPFSKSHS